MKYLTRSTSLWVAGLICLAAVQVSASPVLPPAQAAEAPAFTHSAAQDWLNSAPLDWTQLRGKVVMIEFWAFECWNCYHSIPWLSGIYKSLAPQGFELVAVHTPELEIERSREQLMKQISRRKITYPVMIDNDYSYWKALENRYWPAFYLVDKRGRLRAAFAGETHAGDANAQRIEAAILALLAEADPGS